MVLFWNHLSTKKQNLSMVGFVHRGIDKKTKMKEFLYHEEMDLGAFTCIIKHLVKIFLYIYNYTNI